MTDRARIEEAVKRAKDPAWRASLTAAFERHDDHFSTCQRCGRRVAALRAGDRWTLEEHDCADPAST